MSAETLRKAANLIRENAGGEIRDGAPLTEEGVYHRMTPAAANALADWLDRAAADGDVGPYDNDHCPRALAVACAYLGETA